MIDVNLLPAADLLSVAEKKLRFKLAVAVGGLGIVLVLILTTIFLLDRLGQARLSALQSQQADLTAKFAADKPKINDLVNLRRKIEGIKKIQSTRSDLSQAIIKTRSFLVDGVDISRMGLDLGGNVNFDVTVRDGAALTTYLTNLDSQDAHQFFNSMSLPSLALGPNGSTSFSVAAQFDKSILSAKK